MVLLLLLEGVNVEMLLVCCWYAAVGYDGQRRLSTADMIFAYNCVR
jgi:hypothetical protein